MIVAVNSEILWSDNIKFSLGEVDHSIVVTGVKLDSTNGAVEDFILMIVAKTKRNLLTRI